MFTRHTSASYFFQLAFFIILPCFSLSAPGAPVASARVEATSTYGMDMLVLENEYFKATVAPHEGGRIKSLVWKPTGAQLTPQTADGGLFHDIIQGDVHPGELYAASYGSEVLDAGPTQAVARVWFDGQSRQARGLRFQRTFVLRPGAPYVEVNYDISSRGLSKKTFALRAHNYLMLAGDTRLTPYLPVASGSYTSVFNDVRADLADGWLATVGTPSRCALVSVFDYHELDKAMEWEGFTHEWFYRPVTLLPGQTFHTSARLAFVPQVDNVVGADRRLVLSTARVNDRTLTVSIHALEPLAGTLALDLLNMTNHAVMAGIGEQSVNVTPGQHQDYSFTLPDVGTNAGYLRVTVKTDVCPPTAAPKATRGTAYATPINYWGHGAFKLPAPEKSPAPLIAGAEPHLAFEPTDEFRSDEIRGAGAVKVGEVQETTETEKAGTASGKRRIHTQIDVSNDKTRFQVNYDFLEDVSGKGGHALGEWSGLGLSGQGVMPFYHGGFVDVEFDKDWPLRRYRARIVPRPGMGKGGVDCVWELPQAKVTLRLWLLAGDERVYGRLTLNKKSAYSTASVKMLVFPGWFYNAHDRHVLTPKRDWPHDEQGITITEDGGWMLLYDKLDDPQTAGPSSRGPAAVLWNPAGVAQVNVQCKDNSALTPTFQLASETREFYFALWGFPYLSWPVARSHLAEEGELVGALLAKGPALANISRSRVEDTGGQATDRIRVLQLSSWRNPDGGWAAMRFPELEGYAKPAQTTYAKMMGEITFQQRYWFQGIKNFHYFLKDDPEIDVAMAYEDDFPDKLKNLYAYDVLVINDLDLSVLEPFAKDIATWVEKGRGIIFLGGFGGFGGAGPDYGSYRDSALEPLMPVRIEKTPDWDPNCTYREGQPEAIRRDAPDGYYRTWKPDADDEDCTPWLRQGPAWAIEKGWDWLYRNQRVQVVDATHPVVAGIPLDWLSPGYHRVAPKPGATTIAVIAGHPVIAAAPVGQGRALALAFNDYRRFFFWPHTRQLYRQAVYYAAHREPPLRMASPFWNPTNGSVTAAIQNDGTQPARVSLIASLTGPDFRVPFGVTNQWEIPPNSVRTWQYTAPELRTNEAWLSGQYRVELRMGLETAVGYTDVPWPTNAPAITMVNDHKHHFRRGDVIQPKILGTNMAFAPGARWKVELVDTAGATRRKAGVEARPTALTIPLPVGRLAYGEYRYVVSLISPDGRVLAGQAMPFFICPDLPIPEYAVGWYGGPVRYYGSDDCYEMLAAIDGMREHANFVYPISLNRLHELCDHALGLGMRLGAYTYCGTWDGNRKMPRRSPENRKVIQTWSERLMPYTNFPGLWFIYTDDEGQGGSIRENDFPDYRRQYHADPPAKPWEAPIEVQMNMANFNLETGYLLWGAVHDAFKKINPNWRVGMLESTGNRPSRGGGWFWNCFDNQDLNMIDLYPTTVADSDQDFFWLNQMRCVAARNGKPAWVVLGMYRNDFNSVKMQWWLMMGAGLDGYQWFATTQGMTGGQMDQLQPYDQWAMRYAPLLAQARKPASSIAILQSKAVWSRFVENPEKDDGTHFQSQCAGPVQRVAKDLYERDLYPDVVTEDHLRDGTARQYKYLILPAVDVLEKDTIALLGKMARKTIVMADSNTTVAISGAVPYDADAIRSNISPWAETPNPSVFAEPLKAGEVQYLVVYNHQDRPSDRTEVRIKMKGVKRVRDIFHQRDVPFTNMAQGIVLHVATDAYDGAFLALLRDIPEEVMIRAPASVKAGDDLVLTISIRGMKAGVVPIEVSVMDPGGVPTPYGKIVAMRDSSVKFTVPTAENDRPGKWRVRCTELLTGVTTEREILFE